jgi:grpE
MKMDDFRPIELFDDDKKEVEADFSDITSNDEEPQNDNAPVEETEEFVSEDENTDNSDESTDKAFECESEGKLDYAPILSEKMDEMIESNMALSEQLNQLSDLFNKRILHTDHEEKIIDNMHSELQKYKDDMYSQLIRPILLDIIEVRDSIMRVSAAFLDKSEGEQDIPNKTFSGYAFDLQDILEKNNVEIYRSNNGDTFVPVKQRVIKKVATDNQELHGKVAESLSCGYIYHGRTISAEKISVYYYDESLNNNNKSEVDNNG